MWHCLAWEHVALSGLGGCGSVWLRGMGYCLALGHVSAGSPGCAIVHRSSFQSSCSGALQRGVCQFVSTCHFVMTGLSGVAALRELLVQTATLTKTEYALRGV